MTTGLSQHILLKMEIFHWKLTHIVPRVSILTNADLFNFTFVDFSKLLCSSVNELQQNSNATSREEYIPPN